MERRYDIRLSAAYMNANNDVEVFASDMQHIEDIINSNKGDFKFNPSIGVGINKYLLSNGTEQEISRAVVMNVIADGYNDPSPTVIVEPQKITVNPNIDL
jgi:hypothetical protein